MPTFFQNVRHEKMNGPEPDKRTWICLRKIMDRRRSKVLFSGIQTLSLHKEKEPYRDDDVALKQASDGLVLLIKGGF